MDELSALLSSPSGIFFYQLSTMMLILAAIIVTVGRRETDSSFPTGRIIGGLSVLLILRVVLSLAAAGMETAGWPSGAFLIVERGLSTTIWVVLVWLWALPEKNKPGDTASFLLAALSIALMLLSLGFAGIAPGSAELAPDWLYPGWMALALLLLSAGILLLIRLKPALWGYGVTMLAILGAAELLELLPSFHLDFPVLIRLAQIASFPILLTLPQRIVSKPAVEPPAPPIFKPAPERKRVNLPPAVLDSFLNLGIESDLIRLCGSITETVSYGLVADICLIVSRPTDLDEIIIYCGYDQVLEQEIKGAQIAARHLPMIASAIQKHAPLRLPASSASSDLKFLSSSLRLPKSGHLLVAPIRTAHESGVGALILLTPYSSRTWSQDDQAYLAMAAEKVGHVLDHSRSTGLSQQEIGVLQSRLEDAHNRSLQFETEIQLLKQQLAYPDKADQTSTNPDLLTALEEASNKRTALEARIAGLQAEKQKLEAEVAGKDWEQTIQHLQAENIQLQLTVDEIETSRDTAGARVEELEKAQTESRLLLERLHEENDRLRNEFEAIGASKTLKSSNGKYRKADQSRARSELKKALEEIDRLNTLTGEADIRILELENLAASGANVTRQWESIITMAEELRQPMSSILGYSEFLLTESIGLLGALQRKFLERVKNSTSRMSAMVEDLIHMAGIESGKRKLSLGKVDLNGVIDAAIAATSGQIREKNITLRVNLPDDLPTIDGDRDAIRLTLIHLLHNAAAVSPADGEVSLEIHLNVDDRGAGHVQISVSDSGCGIAPEDLPKVFERRLKSGDGLIGGLGVSRSGLSIGKTLIEAHSGRIWVENRKEAGATFSILLPQEQDIPASIFGKRGL